MFEAAIFDWDGTLADTRQAIVTSFQKALSEVNCQVSNEYIERRIGIGASDTFRDILKSKGIIDELLVKNLVKRKSEVQIELTTKNQLFDGAKDLLENLKGKIKVGLASMNNQAVISHQLEVNNLEEYFQVIVTVDDVSRSKPDPEIFLKTAQKLKVDNKECVVFEDSIFGVKAAKTGGMSCIAVTTGVYTMQELKQEKPDLIVETLKEPRIVPFVLH
ncbi:MAG: HAD family phosphatase [Candidatus Bathyarchaeota archaeon]|nr:HAD family phosphatase [Candidatus Bathyarchaeota archaeon]